MQVHELGEPQRIGLRRAHDKLRLLVSREEELAVERARPRSPPEHVAAEGAVRRRLRAEVYQRRLHLVSLELLCAAISRQQSAITQHARGVI